MAVATEVSNVRYPGNNSTSIEYPVPFPVLDGSHLKVGVRLEGEAFAELPSWKFTVVPKAGGGFAITTTDAIPVDGVVVIWREVPVTQPTELPLAGRLPSTSLEIALDRATMQIQQLKEGQGRCIKLDPSAEPQADIVPTANTLLGFDGDGNFTTLDSATVRELAQLEGDGANATATWADAAAQSAVVPGFTGQLGVRRSDASVWLSQSLVAGAWMRARADLGGKVLVTSEAQFAAALAAGLSVRVVGEIELTTAYDITSAMVIEGAPGAAITLAGADTYGLSVQASLAIRDIKIKSASRLTKRAITIGGDRYVGHFIAQRVAFETLGCAICADGGPTSNIMPDIIVEGCTFKAIGGNGYTGGSGGNFAAVYITWNLGQVIIANNKFQDTWGNAIYVGQNGMKSTVPDGYDNSSKVANEEAVGRVWIVNNWIRDYDRNGIESFGCDFAVIAFNHVIGGSGTWIGGGSGIAISSTGRRATVADNFVKDYWGYGLEVIGDYSTVTGNTVDTCTYDRSDLLIGLSLDGTNHTLVSGNHFINIVNKVYAHAAIHIANATDVTITGNRFTGVSIACNVANSSCDRITFTGNEHLFSNGASALGDAYKYTFAATSGTKHVVLNNVTRGIGAVDPGIFVKVAHTCGGYFGFSSGQQIAAGGVGTYLEVGDASINLVIP